MRSFGLLFACVGGSRARGSSTICAVGAAALAVSLAAPAYAQSPAGAPSAPLPDVTPRAAGADAAAPASGPGLTAEQVGQRAALTSYQAKAAEHNVAAASARADGQWTNYLPRVSLLGRYTRLSDFTPPSVTGGGSLVVTTANPGTVNPTPIIAAGSFSFPLVLDNFVAQASVAIPISDYFLRIGKAYTAATLSEDAARFDVLAARAKSYADGKVAYYTWLRARGAVVVADQSLAVARAHLKDSENQFTVGNANKADVLRAQTQVAAAELSLDRAKSGAVLTERQVRVAIHAKDEDVLNPTESLETPVPAAPTNVRPLVAEAQAARPEVKSIDKNAESARKLADVSHAGKLPVFSAFGDGIYANPNPRRFPATPEWFPTWQAGAQVTWSPNDVVIGNASAADADARASALDAQKSATRDGIEIEVVQAYQAIFEGDAAMASTERQLDSAVEGYRVARELFNNGRGTATTLIDAEIVLAQTRFEHLNARVDARIARVRLDHALGRDAKQ